MNMNTTFLAMAAGQRRRRFSFLSARLYEAGGAARSRCLEEKCSKCGVRYDIHLTHTKDGRDAIFHWKKFGLHLIIIILVHSRKMVARFSHTSKGSAAVEPLPTVSVKYSGDEINEILHGRKSII
jgi:hypothetical protein